MNRQQTINCRGHLLDLSKPIAMGILNTTPDSFYGKSRVTTFDVLKRVELFIKDGVGILDIGGMSSRPGAKIISIDEEKKRVLPVIELISRTFPDALISIDTVHSEVAKWSIEAGASIVNDISAGKIDAQMFQTIANFGDVPYILMHMQGTPAEMQKHPKYDDISLEILDFLIKKLGELRALGVKDVIVDPGLGFGKTIDQNYTLLKQLNVFSIMEIPILIGLSRKSMIYKFLNILPEEAQTASAALHWEALDNGATILRTHDVKETVEVIKLWDKMQGI